METKHTPKPWYVLADPAWKGKHPLHNARYIATCDESKVEVTDHGDDCKSWRFEDRADSIICTMPDAENQVANARLIAAAPDLLEACQRELEALEVWIRAANVPDDLFDGFQISRDILKVAIAKATGETPC